MFNKAPLFRDIKAKNNSTKRSHGIAVIMPHCHCGDESSTLSGSANCIVLSKIRLYNIIEKMLTAILYDTPFKRVVVGSNPTVPVGT